MQTDICFPVFMSNIPHTVRTSLFGYFGKASAKEKLLDPQGSLAWDLLLSVMSSTIIDVHMTPMHHRLSAEPLFVIPTHVHMICSLEVFSTEITLQVRQKVKGCTSSSTKIFPKMFGEDQSVKIVLLKNLAPYSIWWQLQETATTYQQMMQVHLYTLRIMPSTDHGNGSN